MMVHMAEHSGQPGNIDDYISTFPPDVQSRLEQVRRAMHRAVPAAGEAISYRIPTLTLDDRSLVYFAGWKDHLSVYPVPAGDEAFQEEVARYHTGKGTLHFPYQDPIPYDLIEQLAGLLAEQRAAASS